MSSGIMYDVGDRPLAWIELRDDLGALADATASLVLKKPDGAIVNVTAGELDNPSTGRYEYAFTLDQAGVWFGEWRATGPVTLAEPFKLYVRQSRVD